MDAHSTDVGLYNPRIPVEAGVRGLCKKVKGLLQEICLPVHLTATMQGAVLHALSCAIHLSKCRYSPYITDISYCLLVILQNVRNETKDLEQVNCPAHNVL